VAPDPTSATRSPSRFPGSTTRDPSARKLYERQALDEYRALVERLKAERREYLATFPGLREEIVKAVADPTTRTWLPPYVAATRDRVLADPQRRDRSAPSPGEGFEAPSVPRTHRCQPPVLQERADAGAVPDPPGIRGVADEQLGTQPVVATTDWYRRMTW